MKKVAIVGLGWLGMPLALSLIGRGFDVVGSKTTADGVEAARMSGIDCYQLELAPNVVCQVDHLEQLLDADTLVITLPARRTLEGSQHYAKAVRMLVDNAMAFGVPHIIFISSTSVYGETTGKVDENSVLKPVTPSGQVLAELELWLHNLPTMSVDILRLAGLVGERRHPGRFLAGKVDVKGGDVGVNLVHQDDVIAAIQLLLTLPKGGHVYNICAPYHPKKREFYPAVAKQLGLSPPQFVDGEDEEGRVVDGSLICKELGFEYQYPDPSLMLSS